MTIRIGGVARDQRILAQRAVPKLAERAIAADAADVADALNTVTPRGTSIGGGEFLALVVDGRIEPLTIDSLCAYLESRYVLTPAP